MPTRTRVNPKDFTGQQKAKLQEEHAKQVSDRRDEIAMMEQAELEGLDIPIALDGSGNEYRLTENDIQSVDIDPRWVEIRLIADVEKATIGYGTEYNFKAGQVYHVEPHVADWLDNLKYLMYRR